MNQYDYQYSYGEVVSDNLVTGVRIRLNFMDGFYVRTFQKRFRAEVGQKVIVSWFATNNPQKTPAYCHTTGEYYVSDDAIEYPGQWRRNSNYTRRYPKGDTSGFAAEATFLQDLAALGWRVEPATDFEDEKLGVDGWIFLSYRHKWMWVPIDITILTDSNDYSFSKKLSRNMRRGIITLSPDCYDVQGLLMYKIGEYGADNLISRHEAMEKELFYTPPTNHVLNILPLVPKQS